MRPIARQNKLQIQEVGDELIVYDRARDAAHCLNPTAAKVWRYCNGHNSIEDIARYLESELGATRSDSVNWEELVCLTLEELEQYRLIEGYSSQQEIQSKMSRRQALKTATLVGGFAVGSLLPVVQSIVAPTPAMAKSGRGGGKGGGKGDDKGGGKGDDKGGGKGDDKGGGKGDDKGGGKGDDKGDDKGGGKGDDKGGGKGDDKGGGKGKN
jgi:Coenzyme PQQ synthesis protein D (PqqD)